MFAAEATTPTGPCAHTNPTSPKAIILRFPKLALLTAAVAGAAILATPVLASPAVAAPAAPAVVLVNQPLNSVCSGHKFTVGVWYQSLSGGSRAYRISITGPRHRRFFYRHGEASAQNWRYWHVTAGRHGRYRIVYSGHRPGSSKWSRYQVIVHARRCAS
jgi:hypothetical protein